MELALFLLNGTGLNGSSVFTLGICLQGHLQVALAPEASKGILQWREAGNWESGGLSARSNPALDFLGVLQHFR